MAPRSDPLNRVGLGTGAVVIALVLGPLVAVALYAGRLGALGAPDLAAIRFTLVQATLSAAISTAAAIPIARALARRHFAGRGAVITLLSVPFLMPVIIAVMGILAIYGRTGVVTQALAWGGGELRIYGLWGVVLAHVMLNLPLAIRLILQGWHNQPGEQFRLAASLGLRPLAVMRTIEIPMLRQILPGIAAVIFLICMTSFAVALILGGGPRATTVEVAIYQAVRFDFDLSHAASLALVQLGLCLFGAAVAWRASSAAQAMGGLGRAPLRWDAPGGIWRVWDAALIIGVTVFLGAPLVAVLYDGLAGLRELPLAAGAAALRSVIVAFCAGGLCALLSFGIVLRGGGWAQLLAALPLGLSGLVLGTGAFILLRGAVSPSAMALPLAAVVNAIMALPFALRAVIPLAAQAEAEHGRLRASWGMSPRAWVRWGLFPRLRPGLGFGAGIAAAFSMGDLGVITLFGTSRSETLPLYMYRLMGAYRSEAAAGAALVLIAVGLALFWAFTRWGGRHDHI